MREARPSSTAMFVAALRAVASLGEGALISDPVAARFLPRSWAGALALAERHGATRLVRWLPDVLSRGRLQHIALRTRVIDDHLVRAVATGVQQVVLLGAGFDARAYRLASLDACRLFEVDHPATQATKRARVAGLAPVVRALEHVPLDLERRGLVDGLVRAGFDLGETSVVVWEGVTMYLSEEAIRATLGALAELMAPGSRLILTTYDRSGASGPLSPSASLVARLVGERFCSYFSPREAHALLAEYGFEVEADDGRDDWARAHAEVPRGAAPERVMLARRT
jgi:methyltransferase (TIGR00027 family)